MSHCLICLNVPQEPVFISMKHAGLFGQVINCKQIKICKLCKDKYCKIIETSPSLVKCIKCGLIV